MPTRNVLLTDPQEAFICDLVRSGRYRNASEVLRESLHLLERRESLEFSKLNYLRARLDEAEHDAAAGRTVAFAPGLLDERLESDAGELPTLHSPLRL